MSRFGISRSGFIRKSAGAATLGLAACGGGGATIGSNGSGGSPPSGGTGGASAAPGSTATPVPTPTPTGTPNATSTAAAFPSGSVSTGTRGPNSLPDSTRPAGQADPNLPFENVIVLMMENHSFDNYFGMLPKRGQPLADGFTFDSNGNVTNRNPLGNGYQRAFHLQGTCAPYGASQSWNDTHHDVASGAMDGFAATCDAAMGYWDETDIPFYYSLAKTFCLGNRSFCSTQGQTYPNRRYLYSGTSGGLVSTTSATFSMPEPANGTLFDMLTKYGITWKNYAFDLPATVIVPQTLENHPTNVSTIPQFLADALAGTLPQVSFVDPEFGVVDDVGGTLFGYLKGVMSSLPPAVAAVVNNAANGVNAKGGDEEEPQDIAIGEAFVSEIINAVFKSPQWSKTLLIWTYDEHGGYYDHVPPLGAPAPDSIPPTIAATDYQAQFNVTGCRVPTVVVSPYSRPNAVSNVPHDHTSIIATIAAKWNLPALTYRDAQANTLFDYLNLSGPPAFATPPTLAAPALPAGLGGGTCVSSPPPSTITPSVVKRSVREPHLVR